MGTYRRAPGIVLIFMVIPQGEPDLGRSVWTTPPLSESLTPLPPTRVTLGQVGTKSAGFGAKSAGFEAKAAGLEPSQPALRPRQPDLPAQHHWRLPPTSA